MKLLDVDDPQLVYVVAHRGFSGKAPENTLAAFRMALEVGVDMLELDVRLSKDNAVVVIHDQWVDRTTNGRGHVQDMTLEELKSLDAGSWFGKKFAGESIPTLQEVLSILDDRTYVNIEVKSDTPSSERGLQLETRCLEIIARNLMEKRVLFSSFDHHIIKQMKQLSPATPFGVIYNVLKDLGKTPAWLARRAAAEVFICGKNQITKRMVRNAHDRNVKVGVYTVNTAREVERMLRYRVDAIISNFPDVVLRVLGR